MKHLLILLLAGCGADAMATIDLDLDAGVAVTASDGDGDVLGLFGGAGRSAPEDAAMALPEEDAGVDAAEPPFEPEDAGVDAELPLDSGAPEDAGVDSSVVVLGETCDACSSDDDCAPGYACLWRDTDTAKLCFWLPTAEVSCFDLGLLGTVTADPAYCRPSGNFTLCETWKAMQ